MDASIFLRSRAARLLPLGALWAMADSMCKVLHGSVSSKGQVQYRAVM